MIVDSWNLIVLKQRLFLTVRESGVAQFYTMQNMKSGLHKQVKISFLALAHIVIKCHLNCCEQVLNYFQRNLLLLVRV